MLQLLQTDAAVESSSKFLLNMKEGGLEEILHQIIQLGIQAGKNILIALLIFFVGRFLISFINSFVGKVMVKRKLDETIQSFLKSFVSILLNILLIVSVVGALGVNVTSFAALLASAGVAIGMALSGNLQNLAGGLVILFLKPYKIGDYIDAQGVSGVVKAIQIFHTVLTTPDNKVIYVPNGSLSSGSVINYSLSSQRRVDLNILVEYGTEMEKVREVINYLIQKNEHILQDPVPFIALGELAADGISITIRLWTKNEHYWDVYFEMTQEIYEEFNRRGIGFPFKQVTIHQA